MWPLLPALVLALAEPSVGAPDGGALAVQRLLVVPPDACVEAERVAQHAASWLPAGAVVDPRVRVEIRVEPGRLGFDVILDGRRAAERWLEPLPEGCEDRLAALGLAVALALDATVLESIGLGPPPPPPEPPELPEQAPPAPPVTSPPARHLTGAVAVRAVAAVGWLPELALGGEATVELTPVRWLDLVLSGSVVRGMRFPLGAGEVGVLAGTAGLLACPGRTFGRVRLRLCNGVVVGGVRARGFDYPNPHTTTLPMIALAAEGGLRVFVGRRLALDFAARATATLVRPVLRAFEQGRAAEREFPPIGGTFVLGFALPYP